MKDIAMDGLTRFVCAVEAARILNVACAYDAEFALKVLEKHIARRGNDHLKPRFYNMMRIMLSGFNECLEFGKPDKKSGRMDVFNSVVIELSHKDYAALTKRAMLAEVSNEDCAAVIMALVLNPNNEEIPY